MMPTARSLTPLEAAILRTLLYADVFHFPLTRSELHTYLIHDTPVTPAELEAALHSPHLYSLLCESEGYITFLDTPQHITRRLEREALAQALLPLATDYGRWLAALPFVRVVVLTGALAARNPAHAQDDFDYMLIVKPGRVWLARAFSIILVRLERWRGIALCPNYVLSESDLEQQRQDLYIARELAQMKPLFGDASSFYRANTWAAATLPHLQALPHDEGLPMPSWKRIGEWLLSGRIGDALEQWEYRRKSKRFQQQIESTNAARIDNQQVKGHFQDHGAPILQQYEERLKKFGL
jgi:hypothetical protein